jgi:hypothetical protein
MIKKGISFGVSLGWHGEDRGRPDERGNLIRRVQVPTRLNSEEGEKR